MIFIGDITSSSAINTENVQNPSERWSAVHLFECLNSERDVSALNSALKNSLNGTKEVVPLACTLSQ